MARLRRPPSSEIRFAVAIFYAVGLFVTAVIPTGAPSTQLAVPFGLDKWLHAIGYAGFTAVVATVFFARIKAGSLSPRASFRRFFPAVMGVPIVYGFGLEIVQAGLPWRTFDLLDATANALGVTVAAVVVLGWWRRAR